MPNRPPITWFVASVDGGGEKGQIPAYGFVVLAEKTKIHTTRWADFLAGSSTGGLLVNGLTLPDANGFPAKTEAEMHGLYINDGPTIFTTNWLREGINFVAGGGKYPKSVIEGIFKRYFGEALFKNQIGFVMVSAVEMKLGEPWFAKNYDPDDGSRLTRYWCRATSAAPTYFAPVQNGVDGVFWDGGVNANSPALCALAEVISFQEAADPGMRMMPYDDVVVISFGCGDHTTPYTYKQLNRAGDIQLLKPALAALYAGQPQVTHYVADKLLRIQLQQMYGNVKKRRYFRFNCKLPASLAAMDLATPQAIAARQEIAEQLFLKDQADDVAQLVEMILKEQEHRKQVWGELWTSGNRNQK